MDIINYFGNVRHSLCDKLETAIPDSIEAAYNIQKQNTQQLVSIGGWKLGGTTALTRKLFDTQKTYYGALPLKHIYNASFGLILPNKIEYPVGEVEVCFQLSKQVENLEGFDLQDADINLFIDAVMPSIELPWSNFELPESGLKVLVADSCAAGALIVGELTTWSPKCRELLKGTVSLSTNQSVLTEGAVENIVDGPLQALRDFLILAKKHNLELKQDQYVATGGCTPCVKLPTNEELTVEFSKLGCFKFALHEKYDEK